MMELLLPALPIDSILADLVDLAAQHRRIVVEAPAGAGKTTRIPAALARAELWQGEIWVAEPRRLAARLMAHRVASELECKLGERVGYTVRFEDCSSPRTRIRYVTSGILLRRLLSDPHLVGIGCVILDEFHERHLDTDLSLALVAAAQQSRPDLRLLVMSATLDGSRISELLGTCPHVKSAGRLFPLEIEHEPSSDDRPLEKRVSSALRRLLIADPMASTLVFLPGAAEIRRTKATISPLCADAGVEVAVLHGDLPLDEQVRAIAKGARPKVVLTTNIAESSVTVEGITAVVDSGLCRQLDCSAFSGLSRLSVQKISRASAVQRAGRAGRTAPGKVIRLYSRGDFEARPEFDIPEILRADFSDGLLTLCGALASKQSPASVPRAPSSSAQSPGDMVNVLESLLLLDRPARSTIDAAQRLLFQLGAVSASMRLTPIGRRMLDLPLHPRLSRLLIECDARSIGALGALVAAILSDRDLRFSPQAFGQRQRQALNSVVAGDSDVIELVGLYLDAQDQRMTPGELRDAGIDPGTFRSIRQTYQQLRRVLRPSHQELTLDPDRERALATSLLIAYPDRVAKRRQPGKPDVVLRGGATARLADTCVVVHAQWLVVIDVEERRELGRSTGAIVRLASKIDDDWLLDVLADDLTSDEELSWIDPPGRVEVRSRIRIGSLTIEESRRPAKPSPEVADLLMQVAAQRGLLQSEEVTRISIRLGLLGEASGSNPSDPTSGKAIDRSDQQTMMRATELLRELLCSRIDLDGLDGTALEASLFAQLPPLLIGQLRNQVPEAITLPSGRRCPIHYEAGRPPWVASRLQDFFGLAESPSILGGKQRLVIHLLAPNQRPVQVTDDLRGFWSNHYPEIRRQLQRRYPRHAWPEDGLSAVPPPHRPGPQRR